MAQFTQRKESLRTSFVGPLATSRQCAISRGNTCASPLHVLKSSCQINRRQVPNNVCTEYIHVCIGRVASGAGSRQPWPSLHQAFLSDIFSSLICCRGGETPPNSAASGQPPPASKSPPLSWLALLLTSYFGRQFDFVTFYPAFASIQMLT